MPESGIQIKTELRLRLSISKGVLVSRTHSHVSALKALHFILKDHGAEQKLHRAFPTKSLYLLCAPQETEMLQRVLTLLRPHLLHLPSPVCSALEEKLNTLVRF